MDFTRRFGLEGAALGLAIIATGCAARSFDTDLGDGDTGDGNSGDGNSNDGNSDDGNSGDGNSDDGNSGEAPELELAWFNATGKFLTLRFSEPMAPVDGVDPADFRISLALTVQTDYGGGQVGKWSYYWDPLYYAGAYVDLEVDLVAQGMQPEDIVLRFRDPMSSDGCSVFAQVQADLEHLAEEPQYEAMAGLFPHYSPGDIPLQSADGETLAAIGPEWVEYAGPGMYVYNYGWPMLDPQVQIPCNL